jgi:hypothetical protein
LDIGIALLRERARVEWLLRTLPLDGCMARLDALAPEDRQPDTSRIDRIGVWTRRLLANRSWTGTTCLQRALVRYALLTREGARPCLMLGVHPDGALEGHAWVELDGRPWMEHTREELVVTFRHQGR